MSGEFKIILYIIIAFFWFFARMYRKELAKQQSRRQEGDRPAGSEDSEEIFRELRKSLNLPDNEASQERKTESTPAGRMKYEKMVREGTGRRALKKRPMIQPSKLRRKQSPEIVQEVKAAEETGAYRHDFDPRTAVLYSELLKRRF